MASLKALHVQAELFAGEKWLRNQTAPEVAILHGVMACKVISLLEAPIPAHRQLIGPNPTSSYWADDTASDYSSDSNTGC